MIKVKHLISGLLCAVGLIGIALWLSRDFWREKREAYVRGAIEIAADKHGWMLPEIDQIEFSVVGAGPASAADGFPHRVDTLSYHPILSQKTVAGADATEFCMRWRAMTFSRAMSGLCHEPAYGLRFYKDGTLIFETTLCWKCSNFSIPTQFGYMYWGFDDRNSQAQAVLDLLKKHAPLPEQTNFIKE